MRYIFTSAAANYAPKVAQLYASVKKFHPECTFILVAAEKAGVCDRFAGRTHDELISIDDMKLGRDRTWVFQHNIVEISTAIKPGALLDLLDRPDCESVTYIDPDIVLFSPIAEVFAFAGGEAAILTPHLCKPEQTARGVMDHEISCLKHGLYNLGFLSVRNCPGGRAVAQWWHDRVSAHCDADTTTGLFTDQKWMDFLPIFFEGIRIEKSSRLNVAPWNIAQRHLTRAGDTWLVDGLPMGFYHFTGFDSGAHDGVLGHYGKDSPAVYDLVSQYKQEQARLRESLAPLPAWSLGQFSDGGKILPLHRSLFRQRDDLHQAFPDPFTVNDGLCYRRWFEVSGREEHPDLFEPSTTAEAPPLATRKPSLLRRILGVP